MDGPNRADRQTGYSRYGHDDRRYWRNGSNGLDGRNRSKWY